MNSLYTDIDHIRRYVNGELSPQEMFELERAAHEDEMLMDIIIGIEFEKSHQLPNNIDDIRQRIHQRILPVKRIQPFPWQKWIVAASVLLALGIVTYILLLQPQPDMSDAMTTQNKMTAHDSASSIMVPTIIDTAQYIANVNSTERQDKDDVLSKKYSGRSVDVRTDNPKRKYGNLAQVPPSLTSRQPVIDKDSSLEIATLNTGKPNKQDSRIIIGWGEQKSENPQTEEISLNRGTLLYDSIQLAQVSTVQSLKSRDSQARIEQKTTSESPEQTRARLQNMNIDPQTSTVLNRVLDQQARDKMDEVRLAENKRKDTNRTDRTYTYLANVKAGLQDQATEKSDQQTEETLQEVTLNTQKKKNISVEASKSMPVKGWKALDDYLGKALADNHITDGNARLTFKLDHTGKPQQIRVTHSGNKDINAKLIQILLDGPLWKAGNDSSEVELEMKF